jgi:hypothetical protein
MLLADEDLVIHALIWEIVPLPADIKLNRKK